METGPELVGVGNALIDIVSISDGNPESIIGIASGTAVHVDHARLMQVLEAMPEPVFSSGGGAANVVKLASHLGIRSAFVGRTGSDATGKSDDFAGMFRTELMDAGVGVHLSTGPEPTGACAILRNPDGNAAIAACPSAALGMEAGEVSEELVRVSRILVLDGFILGRKTLVDRALDLAERHGTAVALDVGSAEIAFEKADLIAELALKFPLILFMNEVEAEAFACALGSRVACVDIYSQSDTYDELDDRFRPIRGITEAGPFPIVVIKRGPAGALVYASGLRIDAPTLSAIAYDQTGAGDAFAAGFLAAWIRNKPLRDCATLGNRVAREAIAVPGTKLNPARLRHLRRFLR